MIKAVIFDLYNVLYPDQNRESFDLIKKIKQKGYVLGVITSLSAEVARQITQKLNIDSKKVYVSSELGLDKRKVKIYEKFLADQKLKAQECLFVDDSFENLMAAQRTGLKAVCFGPECANFDFSIKKLEELENILKL